MAGENPLVAAPPAEPGGFINAGTGDNGWATGISIAESAMDTYNGIKDGNWIEGGLGLVGLAADAAAMAIDPFGTLLSSAASFLMEHVQPLKDMLDWLAGDPPVIESYSTTWNNVATELGKIAEDYNAAIKSGTEGWTGAAAEAYRTNSKAHGDALSGAASAAGTVGTVVGLMGMVVGFVREMVRDLIADLVGKLIAWVLEAAFTLGFGTPVIVAQAVTAISKWAAKIAKIIQDLLNTIKKVSPMLKRLVEVFEKIMKVVGKLAGKATATADSPRSDVPTGSSRPGRDPSSGSDGDSPRGGPAPGGNGPMGEVRGGPSGSSPVGDHRGGPGQPAPGGDRGGPYGQPAPGGNLPSSYTSGGGTGAGAGGPSGGSPSGAGGPSGGGSPSGGGAGSTGNGAGGGSTGGGGGSTGGGGGGGNSAPPPARFDQTSASTAATADAPVRPDQPQTGGPNTGPQGGQSNPGSTPPPGGMPAGGAPGGAPGGTPGGGAPGGGGARPGSSGGWTGTPGSRGDVGSAIPAARGAEGPRPSSYGPTHSGPGTSGPTHTAPSAHGPSHGGSSPSSTPHGGSPHTSSPHNGPGNTGPSHNGPSNTGPAGTRPHSGPGPTQSGPPHTGPTHSGPSHNAPGNTSPSHNGPGNAGPSNTGPGHNGPSHSGPAHTSPSQAGPPHASPPHHGPGNTGPSHANPPHGNPAPGGTPHANQPHTNQPNTNQPNTNQPNTNQPNTNQPHTGPQSRGPVPTSHPNVPHQPSSPHAPNRPFGGPPPQRHPDAQTPSPRHAPDSAPPRHTPDPSPRQDPVPHQRSDQDPWSPPQRDPDGPGTADRPDIDDAHARHGETTPAGISHHRGDSEMGDLPQRVPHDPRYFTADVHITPDGRARIGNHSYSPEEYGDLLRRNGWDGKTPIRLIGCDAGSNDFANRLSRHTGADVLAPTKPAWTDSNGRVYTSDAEVDPDGNRRPRIPPNGEWETHRLDGTRNKASDDGFVPGTNDADKHDLDPDDARDRAARDNTITDPPEGRDPTPQRTVPWDPPEDLPRVDVEVDPNQRVLDFNGGPPLEPNSRVVVHNPDGSVRGTYYTDANGNVTHVDTSVPNTRNSAGVPVNPDTARPEPGVVYQVDTGVSTHTFRGQEVPDAGTSRPDTTAGTTDTGRTDGTDGTNNANDTGTSPDRTDAPGTSPDTTPDTTPDATPDSTPDASPDHRPADRFDDFDQTRTPPAVEWNPPGGPDGTYRTMPPHENYNPAPPPDGDGPFSLRGNDPDNPLEPHARYDVHNDNGDWHGTFYTDADGRVSHVHTWSGNSTQGFNPELGTAETWDANLPVPAPNTTFAVGPRHVEGMDPEVPQQMYRTDVHGDTIAASGRPVYPPSGTRAEDFWGPRRGVEPGSPGEGVQPDTGRIASGGPEGYKSPTAGEYAPFNYYGDRHELFKFDGGHIVAFEGGGPGERINHVPQWAYENRPMKIDNGSTDDTWRRVEEDIARRAAVDGTTVDRVDFFAERTTPDIHTPDKLHVRYHFTVSDPPPPRTVQEIRSFHNVPEPARNNRVVLPPPTP
ncbi:hypothetical protein [Saccharothrix sp. NRRL B-16314]|uniref:hypothetical protein n=1 Tax=Saccharothrix sp. NRRL B-16314 TaxID=1463825 RepID=UPI00068DCD38|nr:hypothetical protein [Saccharothrix sp. NRRL B-16314]